MGGWGRQNPWPFQWGGGKSIFETTWDALRAMLGVGGPGPRGSLEDAWREAKVAGIVKVLTMPERAALQALPSKATDHIEVYETLLKVPRETTEEGRRAATSAAWTESLNAIVPELAARLEAIDEDLSIVTLDPDETFSFHFGAAFETSASFPFTPSSAATQFEESSYPMFSQHFVIYVLWENQPGGIPPTETRDLVERELNKSLPSWVDWKIITKIGFILDSDPLDLTAFGA